MRSLWTLIGLVFRYIDRSARLGSLVTDAVLTKYSTLLEDWLGDNLVIENRLEAILILIGNATMWVLILTIDYSQVIHLVQVD